MTLNWYVNYLVALSVFFIFLFFFIIKQIIIATLLPYYLLCFMFLGAGLCVAILIFLITIIADIFNKLRLIYFTNFTDKKIKNFFVRRKSYKNNLFKQTYYNLILKKCFIRENTATYDIILVEDIRLFNLIKLYRSHIFSYETVLIIYYPDHSELTLKFNPLPDDYFKVTDVTTYSRFKMVNE